MTQDEYILQRLKDEHAMYGVLFFACVAAAVAAVALAAASVLVAHKPEGVIIFGCMTLYFVFQALLMKSSRESYAAALAEIGDAPAGIADNHDFSRETASIVARSWLGVKQLRAQTIAYSACAVMCIAGAVVIYMIPEEELLFPLLGTLLLVMGLYLVFLAWQALRNLRAYKRFQSK